MSKQKLKCMPNPCNTCPYRRDTPLGIWDKAEYDKLPQWDEPMAFAGTFLCHQRATEKDTVCRGWLEVHEGNMSQRIACFGIEWNEHNRKPTTAPLYRSGAEARKAGLKGVRRPNKSAKAAMVKIVSNRERNLLTPIKQASNHTSQ